MTSETKSKMPPRDRAKDRQLTRWFWREHVKRWTPHILLGFLFMAIEGAMAGAMSSLFKPMFDDVLVAGREDMVLWVAFGFGAIFVTRAAMSFLNKTLMAFVANKAIASIQAQLTRHLMTLDQSFHHSHPPGHLIDRVRGDTMELNVVFERVIPVLGRDLIGIVILIGVATYTDWLWTLVALLGLPLLVLPIALLQRMVRAMGHRARVASASASTRLDEIFHGIVTIQRNGLEDKETTRLDGALKQFVRSRIRTTAGESAMASATDMTAAVGFVLVLTLAGSQIIAGERTVGEFMTFFSAVAFLFDPLRRLGSTSGVWQNVLASLERIHGLLAIKPTITQPKAPLAPLPATGKETIRVENLTFAYDNDPVLRSLSFEAKAGQTTALVGPSGAGKSTVFALLTRLADPQDGRIVIGGEDIRQMDLRGLRDLFSVVAQDNALFDETLRDNILMGQENVSDDRLMAAVRAAHVDEFLPQLPNGLDTRVGPRGSALSGGQRQRVAIARALLREAPILLLDEATSALDARSEALVQEALDQLSDGRTTLVIAHRLSTIRRADKIVVMEAGSVVEEGTHESLLAKGGVYARLHALQFADDAE